jgi:hypothetical protein
MNILGCLIFRKEKKGFREICSRFNNEEARENYLPDAEGEEGIEVSATGLDRKQTLKAL